MGNTKILLNKIFLKIKDTLVNRDADFPMYIRRCQLAIKSLWLGIVIVFPDKTNVHFKNQISCNLSKHIIGLVF